MRIALIVVLIAASAFAQGPSSIPAAAGGGGGAATVPVSFRAACNNSVSGSNFDGSSSVGTIAPDNPGNCDSATGNIDAFVSFVSGATTHRQGHFYLPTGFTDGIKATILWNSTAVTGAAVWGIAAQCVSSGALPSATGYGSYVTFASSTAAGTASALKATTTLTWTTGCAAGQMLYFDLELTSGNNTLAGSAAAQLKWLDLEVTL